MTVSLPFNSTNYLLPSIAGETGWGGQMTAWITDVSANALTSLKLASPPAIGTTTPAAGAFTTLTASGTLGVSSTISLGTGVAPNGDTTISTPSGSNININPQGTAYVKIGSELRALRGTFNPITFPIVSGAAVPVITANSALAGTLTTNGTNGWNSITAPSDNLAMTGTSAVLSDFQINHNFGGPLWSGARIGLQINMFQTANISLGAGGGLAGAISGICSGVTLNHTFGGTALTPGNAAGAATAMNPYLILASGYTNGGGGSGMEIDVSGRTGSSFLDKTGLIIVLDSQDSVQGARGDAALTFANQTAQGAGRGWRALISSGSPNGCFPLDTGGSFWIITPLVAGDTLVANKGLAWSNGTFTTSAIETPGFTVDGSGNVTALKISSTTNLTLGSGTAIATNATNGMILIPTCAGAPTGSVGSLGKAAMVYDSTDSKLYISTGGGTWKSVTLV